MTPRSWDVGGGRASAIGVFVAATLLLAGCGQARLAQPPAPEFTSGQRAEPTTTPTTGPATTVAAGDSSDGDEPDLSAIEPDAESIDVDQMLIIDDAGIAAPNRSGWAEFDASLRNRLIPADASASVAVMIDGEIVHAAAFGERVAGSGEVAEPTDRFRVASISKTITAIVALRLVEQGVLTLDDPIGQTLIDHLGLVDADPDVPAITVRRLLSHTAGFPKHYSTFFSNGATSCVDAARQGLTDSVSGGNGYSYANMGYCVLGLLIEAVTGKTYERVVYEELLTPLGISGMRMTSTYELGPDEVSHHPTPNRNFMETLAAAGSWNATPSNLVTIINSVDPTTGGWKALSPEMMAAMRHRIPSALPPSGYGLGVINYGNDTWGHTGTIQNTHAMVLVQPDGVTWAVTVSGETPSESTALGSIVRRAFAAGFPGD